MGTELTRLPVMPLPAKPPAAPLPPDLAFVVQLQAPGHQPPDALAGRVEHIATGRAACFASLSELFAFFDRAAPSSPRTSS